MNKMRQFHYDTMAIKVRHCCCPMKQSLHVTMNARICHSQFRIIKFSTFSMLIVDHLIGTQTLPSGNLTTKRIKLQFLFEVFDFL